ncbi:MAG: hypothetical protein ACLFWL_19005 [Candidatus Brocadiia bacterium]
MRGLKPSSETKVRLFGLALILVFTLTAAATPRKESQETPEKTPTEQQSQSQRIQLPAGSLPVQAIYPDQKPVRSASIKMWHQESGKFVWTDKADEEGNFEIPELDAGQYLLIVAERVAIPVETGIESADGEGPFFVLVPHGKSQFAELSARAQARALTQFEGGGAEEEEGTEDGLYWDAEEGSAEEEDEDDDDDEEGMYWTEGGEESPGFFGGLVRSPYFWGGVGAVVLGLALSGGGGGGGGGGTSSPTN